MQKITVSLKEHSYPIFVTTSLVNQLESLWPLKCGDNVMLVTNNHIAQLYLKLLTQQLLQLGVNVDYIILPDGEHHKSLIILNQIITALLSKFHNRDTILIAFGGGMIGDLTGFAAAIYKRGIRFIQIPTTILSQVDSSIGGKNSINHSLGKNMIGTIYQPISVIINLNYLNTLSKRERSSGLAEVIKYAIINDSKFFIWLENNIEALLLLKPQEIAYCVYHCCQLKAKIVSADEIDQGERLLLNFGHTYAHAIESYMGYGKWLHGEAVAAGMMIAAHTANYLGQFTQSAIQRISRLLQRVGLPIKGPINMLPQDYLSYIKRDKKYINGKLHLVLPVKLGSAKIFTDITHDMIISSINNML